MHNSTTSDVTSSAANRGTRRSGWTRRLMADILFVAKRDRKWWLLPLVLLLLLMAAFIVVGMSLGPLAPFIYPLF